MSELDTFLRDLPLPPGWARPTPHADEIRLGPHTLRRVGLECKNTAGVEATGSAASAEGDPLDRAYFELYVRIAILEAMNRSCAVRDRAHEASGEFERGGPERTDGARRRPARSNGVAFHSLWEPACERALLELVERDGVLSAWYGERGIQGVPPPEGLASIDTHRWRAGFVERAHASVEAFVAIVVGFPVAEDAPLARGFGAARSPTPALVKAAEEAIQNLAFLCDSPVPDKSPPFAPNPIFHLDYYLTRKHHAILERWLDSSIGYGRVERIKEQEVRFVDLTPKGAPPNAFVARALSPVAHPLYFGDPPEKVLKYLPEDRWVHPIP